MGKERFYIFEDDVRGNFGEVDKPLKNTEIVDLLNEQQELIEELHISDHMGWGRAEKFEKELKQKKIYIKRLEYKVQKFKEMNGEQQATISALHEENTSLKESQDGKRRAILWWEHYKEKWVNAEKKLRKLKEENEQLRQQLKEKEEDEQLYANEIVKLNKEAKEVLNFKKLGGEY